MPCLASSSSWVPVSAIVLSSMTTIWSAYRMIGSVCAIMTTVLWLPSSCCIACFTLSSFSISRADVASSSRTIGESRRIARAMDNRCLSPPESRQPFSPISVSYPFASLEINSVHPALSHAASIYASVADGLAWRIFSRTVSLNRITS